MSTRWICGGLLALALLPAGCGRSGGGETLGSEAKKLAEVAATATEIPTTTKTPGGRPVRVYEVAVKDQKHAVAVVGDPAAPVEFANARFISVGGKKAELNLASATPGSYMVPVVNPACGYRQLEMPPADLLKLAKENKPLAVPMVDQVVDVYEKKKK